MPPRDVAQTYDFFSIGMELGWHEVAVAPLLDEWEGLFPGGARGAAPAGLIVSVMMRGYLALLDRRPMGNVHVSQHLRWGSPAGRNAMLSVSTRCTGKECRSEKPRLTFVTIVAGADGTVHLTGEMRSLWAA